MLTLKIQRITTDGYLSEEMEVEVALGSPLFILGVNGSGKSELMFRLSKDLKSEGKSVAILAGMRQLGITTPFLDSSSTNRQGLVKQRAGNLGEKERTSDSVKDGFSGAAIHQLADRENEMARKTLYALIESEGQVSKNDVLPKEAPPIQRLNKQLRMARFPFRIELTGERASIQIVRNSHGMTSRYGLDEASDGERSAILTAAVILSAPRGTTFFIDEPEIHMHPALARSFLPALFAERTDCYFLVATNQLDLSIGAKNLVLRSCIWERNKVRGWDIPDDLNGFNLPERLKREILGSRRKILFVEGEEHSLDAPLYRGLFPDPELSIVPCGSYKDVIGAVDGIRKSQNIHDVEAFGLIDGDGGWRDDNYIASLEKRGIYVSSCYSVESLYCCKAAIESVARAFVSRKDNDNTLDDVDQMVVEAIDDAIEELGKMIPPDVMASRVCVQRVDAQINNKKPTAKDIRTDHGAPVVIKVDEGAVDYENQLECYKSALTEGNFSLITARYPLKDTGVFASIARGFRYPNGEEYVKAVVNLVRNDPALEESLKEKLGGLTKALQ